jgi:hypothetical protein
MASKINQILAKWLPGDVHTLRWFEENGVSQRVAFGYSESHSIQKIGAGAFSLPGSELSWLGATRAMQQELQLPIHVGARTALELHGTAHNVAQTAHPTIIMIASKKISVPQWVRSNQWNAELLFKRSSLIDGEQSLTDFTANKFNIKISTREQAILELIDSIDLSRNFETAENHLLPLMTLRPALVQELLTRCTSIKVKRVFLYLAEKMNMPFFSKLALDAVDLGTGKRVVVKGGRFNSKYKITVPHEESEDSVGF